MLDRVDVKCFQSLESVELELRPLTAFIGESDQGKSAILRAIQSLFSNRSGADFVTFGHERCSVKGELDERQVSWVKGKGANYFTLDGKSFDKVGQGVPEDLSGLFNVGQENIAGQFDRPFLVFDSGSAISSMLGGLTNIALLYDSVREANRDKTTTSSKLGNAQTQLNKVTVSEEELAGLLEPLSEIVRQLEALEEHRLEVETAWVGLKNLIITQSEWEFTLQRYEPISKVSKVIGVLEKAVAYAEARAELAYNLQGLISSLCEAKAQVYEGEVPEFPTALVDEMEEKLLRRNSLWSLMKLLATERAEVEVQEDLVDTYQVLLDGETVALNTALEGLHVCPFSEEELYDSCREALRMVEAR